ncbi:MAG: hypothetical protein M3R08_09650 [Bacteroidota bacterium]|nr:hypothetical protein [Bacteroidota bacterium]
MQWHIACCPLANNLPMPDTPNKKSQEEQRGTPQNPKDGNVEKRKAKGGQGNSKGDNDVKKGGK